MWKFWNLGLAHCAAKYVQRPFMSCFVKLPETDAQRVRFCSSMSLRIQQKINDLHLDLHSWCRWPNQCRTQALGVSASTSSTQCENQICMGSRSGSSEKSAQAHSVRGSSKTAGVFAQSEVKWGHAYNSPCFHFHFHFYKYESLLHFTFTLV